MPEEFALRPRVEIDGTPLPSELEILLERVVVDDHLHTPDMFTITFRDTDRQVLSQAKARIGSKVKISAPPLGGNSPEVMIDADSYYVLASVFKTPVLVEAFFQLHEGRFSLDERWPLATADKNLPSGVLTFFEDGLRPSARDLLTLMIIISDNTATDMMMKRLGKENINARLRALGLDHIHVPLTVREIFDSLLPSSDPTQDLHQLEIEAHRAGPRHDSLAYQLGPENNVGAPREMTRLIGLIFEALGWLFSVFYYSYTIAMFAIGLVLDRSNLRWAFAAAVLAWHIKPNAIVKTIDASKPPNSILVFIVNSIEPYGRAGSPVQHSKSLSTRRRWKAESPQIL